MKKGWRVANWTAGIALAAYAGYFYYSMATGEERMGRVCAEFHSGMLRSDAERYAQLHGLTLPRRDDGLAYIGEARTMERYACRIEMQAGRVVKSELNFAD